MPLLRALTAFDMCTAEIISIIKDILIAVAAAVTATVAVLGLKSWSRELRGKADFEVARGLIRATYKLRDELGFCRSPFIRAQEFPEGYYKPTGKNTPQEEAEGLAYVYKNRWQPVWNAIQEFDVQALEAEALWGSDLKAKTNVLRKCVSELNAAIDALISDKSSGGRDFESDREFGRKIRSTVSASGGDSKNELSKKIIDAVTKIEDKVRAHLKRS